MKNPPHHRAVGIILAGTLLLSLAAGLVVGIPQAAASTTETVSVITGCEPDPEALKAISQSVSLALDKSRSGDSTRTWRVHSICKRGAWAYAYVKSYFPNTSSPLPSPSDVALVQLTANGWRAALPENARDYNALLASMPTNVVPESMKKILGQPTSGTNALYAPHYSGYALPFPNGESAWTSRHYYPALDFDIGGHDHVGTVRNAKAGTVVFVKGSSTRACGDPPPDNTCWQWANVIVIQAAPDEYVWYLHLAQNSIPEWIHEGVYVPAGADLGQEGETGWATGPHVHFMVSSIYSCCTGSDDSLFPDWPSGATFPVDFIEYSWFQVPFVAISQNGSPVAGDPSPPPAEEPTPIPAPPEPEIPSPTEVAPQPTTAGCPNPYAVQPGEWLYKIARDCHVSPLELIAANPGINPAALAVGQLLNMPPNSAPALRQLLVPDTPAPPIPAADLPPADQAADVPAAPTTAPDLDPCAGTHTVAAGENLFRIALNCGLTLERMAAANHIFFPYLIHPGQVLKYP